MPRPCSAPTEKPYTTAATSARRKTGLRLPMRHSTRVSSNMGATAPERSPRTGDDVALVTAIGSLAHQPDVGVLERRLHLSEGWPVGFFRHHADMETPSLAQEPGFEVSPAKRGQLVGLGIDLPDLAADLLQHPGHIAHE